MNETRGESWKDLEDWLEDIESERSVIAGHSKMHVSPPLFRGHADANWDLATTIERQYPKCTSVKEYYRRAYFVNAQIEAHTGQHWNLATIQEYEELADKYLLHQLPSESTMEYLAYLRHHGFPSPLLDWTQSPFVAAYFAFGSASPRIDRVAIFAYIEYLGSGKETGSGSPSIRSIGSYIKAHRRHYLQQSEYTFCVIRVDGDWHYASHDSAIWQFRSVPQDLIRKITLPSTMRAEVLSRLDRFNLNAFSLMGSEESLMETVAFRAFGPGRV